MVPVDMPGKEQDRRRAPRVPLVAKGQVVNRSMAGAGAFEAVSADVSEGGLRLVSSRGDSLSLHDFLVINFPNPDSGNTIECKAQVVWVSRSYADKQGAWSFGCSFFQTPPDTVLHLMVRAHRDGGRA